MRDGIAIGKACFGEGEITPDLAHHLAFSKPKKEKGGLAVMGSMVFGIKDKDKGKEKFTKWNASLRGMIHRLAEFVGVPVFLVRIRIWA